MFTIAIIRHDANCQARSDLMPRHTLRMLAVLYEVLIFRCSPAQHPQLMHTSVGMTRMVNMGAGL